MNSIVQIIKSLPNLLSLKPATIEQIKDAELQLNVTFANEYKDYLSAFGAIMADGIELSGMTKSEYRNVVTLTRQEWAFNVKVPHTMYVVENTGIDGIIIWQDSAGCIYESKPNFELRKIAPSLAEYILSRIV